MYDQPTSPPYERQTGSTGISGWLVGLLVLLVGVLIARMAMESFSNPSPIAPRGDLAADEQSTIELYEQAQDSVVHITNLTDTVDSFLDASATPQGSGSGFVWDREGHIVTNYHVVENAKQLHVRIGGNSIYDARIVGIAPDADLAVLKISAPRIKLKPILRGESRDLVVGQKVFAIGNPFGLDRTLTTGVIGGLGRQIRSVTDRPIFDVIQTDAAINPGNSGGPLLDSSGRLIGVNTAIASRTGSSAGIGFAVPVDTVNRMVPQLIEEGVVERPGLGISLFPNRVVQMLVNEETLPSNGVLILKLLPDGAAAASGMRGTVQNADGTYRWGDLITSVDGNTLSENEDLLQLLDRKSIGDVVEVIYQREGQEYKVSVTLKALPTAGP